MKDLKLILLLKSFSKQEIKDFEKFLQSSFLNTSGEYILKFFEAIKKYYPQFESEKFTKQNVFVEIYPEEKYNDARMRKLVSETLKLALDYLGVKNFLNDEQAKGDYILTELKNRNSDNLFESKIKDLFKLLDKNKIKDYHYYSDKFRLTEALKSFYFNRERKKAIPLFDDEIRLLSKYFSLLFIHKFIERYMEKRSFTDVNFYLPYFNEIINFAEENYSGKENLFDLYYTELLLHINGDEKYYFSLKHLKEKLSDKIHKNSLSLIYFTLTNYATEQFENGKLNYLNELFNLHKEILKKKIYGNIFSEFLFLNIVTVALRLDEIKFAEKFINEYKNKMNRDVREDTYNYSLASIYFSKKEFSRALETLSKINFTYSLHKYLIKNLTLKIYYELNEPLSIYSLIDSFKHTIKRDKSVPQNVKILITNYTNFVKELVKIKHGEKTKEDIESRIKKEITAEKSWLISKVREFK
jgi:hypothetical protein